jgi:hypothetical protein
LARPTQEGREAATNPFAGPGMPRDFQEFALEPPNTVLDASRPWNCDGGTYNGRGATSNQNGQIALLGHLTHEGIRRIAGCPRFRRHRGLGRCCPKSGRTKTARLPRIGVVESREVFAAERSGFDESAQLRLERIQLRGADLRGPALANVIE